MSPSHFLNLSIGSNSLTVSHQQEFLIMKYTIVYEDISKVTYKDSQDISSSDTQESLMHEYGRMGYF